MAGLQARQAIADDDEDEDYVPGVADLVDPCNRTAPPTTRNAPEQPAFSIALDDGSSGSEALPPASKARGGCGGAHRAASPATALNDNSDPPGALFGYMAADSELPEPAAPSRDTASRLAAMGSAAGPIKAEPVWMQPDPIGPTSFCAPAAAAVGLGKPLGSDAATALASMAWDSTVSTFVPYALAAAASAAVNDSPASTTAAPPQLPSRMSLTLPAERPARVGAGGSLDLADGSAGFSDCNTSELSLHRQHRQQLQQAPTTMSPFADMAVAAAAGGGGGGWTGARAAAALLRSAAAVPSLPLATAVPRVGPAWLRGAGGELDALMADIGILAGPAGASQQSILGPPARPSALTSNRPLTLPPPRPKRNLDSMLRAAGSAAAVGVRQRTCGAADGVSAAAAAGPEAAACQWKARTSDGMRLNAIDCMPLDALL